jgi:DNA-binding winged helix-turn-helix (wHTH) protein
MYAEGGIEPRLEELLNDPLTEAVMRRDGVSVASLRELISSMRKGLRERIGP